MGYLGFHHLSAHPSEIPQIHPILQIRLLHQPLQPLTLRRYIFSLKKTLALRITVSQIIHHSFDHSDRLEIED